VSICPLQSYNHCSQISPSPSPVLCPLPLNDSIVLANGHVFLIDIAFSLFLFILFTLSTYRASRSCSLHHLFCHFPSSLSFSSCSYIVCKILILPSHTSSKTAGSLAFTSFLYTTCIIPSTFPCLFLLHGFGIDLNSIYQHTHRHNVLTDNK
jgi:hypothetical protein